MKQMIKGFIGDTVTLNQKIMARVGDFQPTSRIMTDKGLLCKDAVLALAPQVREYHPAELGLKDWSSDVIRLYTPPEVLFTAQLMDNIKEVSDNHPDNNQLTPDNWKKYVIGSVENTRQVNDELLGDLLIKDATAIKNIETKKKTELSIGYEFIAEIGAGKTESGESYDAIITSMIGDHVALVKVGRGGKRVRIGDSKQEEDSVKIKIMLSNGQVWEVEVGDNADAFKQSFDADQQALKDAVAALQEDIIIGDKTFKVSETVAIQAAFAAINKQKLEAEEKVTTLEKSAIRLEDIEKLAAERAETINDAKSLKADIDEKGKSVEDIKKEAVTAHADDETVKAVLDGVPIGDAMPDKIHTAFKVLSATKKTPNKNHSGNAGDSDNATAKALAALNNADFSVADAEAMVLQQKSDSWKGE